MKFTSVFYLLLTMASAELVQVNVTQGTLQGEYKELITGDGNFYSFKGVPYAAPPVGELRFKAPQPPLNWTGVRDATSHGSSCPQIDILTSIVNLGNEDCLFLNIYSPNLAPSTLLPVMFYIHGGGFKSGSGNDSAFGPDFLVSENVLLVTINYRLEALGFLSLDTEDVPGNAGLKDQVAALRWVNENIENFGGDPENVTIFGQSAGGASVGLHTLSPLSKGLFQRAIAMSGVPLCDFLVSYKPRERAFILGEQLGIYTNDTTELLNRLQEVSVDKLINTTSTVLASEDQFNLLKIVFFPPVNETDFGNNSSFITKYWVLNTDVDMMFGYASKETASVIKVLNSTYMSNYERYLELFVPTKMYYHNTPDVNLQVGKMIRDHYFSNKTINVEVIQEFLDYTSTSSFVYDITRFINILPPSNKTRFLYRFSMSSGLNYYGNQALAFDLPAQTGHLDDNLYIFVTNLYDSALLTKNSTEYALKKVICSLWANFAKFGNPTPDDSLGVTWLEYGADKNFLEIGNTLSVGTNPESESLKFWECLFNKFGFAFYLPTIAYNNTA